MKRTLLLSMMCAFFVAFATQSINAQGGTNDVLASNNVLSIKSVSESTNTVENFRNFEIEVNESGNYYAQFWLQPAKYANGSYTTFKVYVNDELVGTIKPTKGNWQSASIDKKSTLKLNSGNNVISIATNAPEFPDVESVRLSKDAGVAAFSSKAYDSYLESATKSKGIPKIESYEETDATTFGATPYSVGMTVRQNIPLKYSFYKTFSFTAGQEIFITSSSHVEHAIDIFYYGKQRTAQLDTTHFRPYIPTKTSVSQYSTINPPYIKDSTFLKPIRPAKFLTIYTPATSEEIQGMNWKGLSEKAVNSSNVYVATIRLTIPKSGIYMVKMRSANDRVLSVADLNVNGVYYYENTPIYYAYINCVMLADGNSYAALTMCDNQGVDDPLLFVEGSTGGRIVGYNDDAPANKAKYYDLDSWDSYIRQTYRFPTSGLHISSYSSSKPESKCIIMGNISEEAEASSKSMIPPRAKANVDTEKSNIGVENTILISPKSPDLTSSITISSKEEINAIQVYNISGIKTATYIVDDYRTTIPLSELNINSSGLYIFSIETKNGNISQQKISVR